MAEGFHRFRFHIAEESAMEAAVQPTRRGMRASAPAGAEAEAGFANDETAARFYLSTLLETDDRPAVREMAAPERAELVPDLQLVGIQEVPQTGTKLVHFQQRQANVPVFGSKAVCEINQDRGLVSADAELAEATDVSPMASLSQVEALSRIAELAGVDAAGLQVDPPELMYFRDPRTGSSHLTYHFRKVPAAPPELVATSRGHGLGASPRSRNPLVDYFVDAHDGEVVYYYSSTPMLDVPVQLRGVDELDQQVQFWGRRLDDQFELRDPLREVTTFDLELGDIDRPNLTAPLRFASATLDLDQRAAVSAHVNASKVVNFYKSVLFRDGVDDKGMDLVNVVNCTYSADQDPPAWNNAVWYDNRMWYGQAPGPGDRLVSYARFLDVIAHELTHGVTEYTSGLVYRDQSGALNESFSDIIGIMVKNWDWSREDGGDVSGWDWEIGSGLGSGDLPLRDVSDPTRTGDPDHMDDFLVTTADSGGVHTNSNIHNKAAYNLLTAEDGGSPAFTPRDAAYLYYLCLSRLGSLATFSDTLDELIAVANTFYGGDPPTLQKKLAVIREAYAKVGITEPT